MPLYMDRHFLHGATAEAVAEAHQLDIKSAKKYGCQALTYWFNEETGVAFCLISAPDKNSVEELHKNTHGLIPNKIIAVDGNIVELFLGRVTDPETNKKINEFENAINESAFRAIMHIEFKFTTLEKLKTKPIKNHRKLKIRNKLIRQELKQFNGREIVEHTEGSFVLSFHSITNSIECAISIQNNFKNYNDENAESKIHVGIGLCAGSPVTESGDFFGESIKLAKRLCDIATEDQLVVSSTVSDLYKEKSKNYFEDENIINVSPKNESFLSKLMDVTEQIWDKDKFNVDHFSKQIGLSKSQLNRKIISLTGKSPNIFIKDYRLDKALKLLLNGTKNISEITFETGFSSLSYFSKCFQKRYNLLPSELLNTN